MGEKRSLPPPFLPANHSPVCVLCLPPSHDLPQVIYGYQPFSIKMYIYFFSYLQTKYTYSVECCPFTFRITTSFPVQHFVFTIILHDRQPDQRPDQRPGERQQSLGAQASTPDQLPDSESWL